MFFWEVLSGEVATYVLLLWDVAAKPKKYFKSHLKWFEKILFEKKKGNISFKLRKNESILQYIWHKKTNKKEIYETNIWKSVKIYHHRSDLKHF